jgi:hypothetical protein
MSGEAEHTDEQRQPELRPAKSDQGASVGVLGGFARISTATVTASHRAAVGRTASVATPWFGPP